MGSIIFSKKDFEILLEGGGVKDEYICGQNYAFLPIPYLIYLIEQKKKVKYMLPNVIKDKVELLRKTDCVNKLPITRQDLMAALKDTDFCENRVSKRVHPFALSSYICIRHCDECWGNLEELIDNLESIVW